MRIMVVHLGVHGWQLAFTPDGLPPSAKAWMNLFCKERLTVDVRDCVIVRGLIFCMFRELFLYTNIASLGIPELLLSSSVIALALYNTIILITSFNP